MEFLHPWHEHLFRHPELSYTTFFGEPVVLHCHHFNLFLDQTVEDPPYIPGRRILFQNAYEASFCLLSSVQRTLQPQHPENSLELFLDLLAYLGLGRFKILEPLRPDGGAIAGTGHYTTSWINKYGQQIHRDRGVEYFLRGFLAAAIDIAFELEPGHTRVRERSTPIRGEDSLILEVLPPDHDRLLLRPCLGAGDWEELSTRTVPRNIPAPPFDAESFHHGLASIADQLSGGPDGLIQGFHVWITRHLVRYYNGISADFYRYLRNHKRDLANVGKELLEESGHVCVFHTFGNMLRDPEIQKLAGGLTTPEHYIFATATIGRALGFGDWEVRALEPGESLELQASQEYEGCQFRHLDQQGDLPLFFMPGATAAAMNLVYLARIYEGKPITHQEYNQLMMGFHGEPFHGSTLERCHRGDPYTRTRAERSR